MLQAVGPMAMWRYAVGSALDVAADPDDHARVVVALRDAMTRAVRRLPMRQREVVVLRFILDLSITDTASALGTTEGTVKSHTARALARMRELLTEARDIRQPISAEVRHVD
jgi:DNA-directed RNA polymerase specialized sigma24 family protein